MPKTTQKSAEDRDSTLEANSAKLMHLAEDEKRRKFPTKRQNVQLFSRHYYSAAKQRYHQ